jgi:hypothetical protein
MTGVPGIVVNLVASLPEQEELDKQDQFADVARHEKERGRLSHAVHPEGLAGKGQGIELVACAQRHYLLGNALVLAQGEAAVNLASGRGNLAATSNRGIELEIRGRTFNAY